MKVSGIVDRLRVVAGKVPNVPFAYPLTAPSFAAPVTPHELALIESHFSGQIPVDYRAFLQHCAAITAMDIQNGYALFPPDLLIRMDDGPRRILKSDTASAVPVLPIGGDGGGNLFLLEVTSRSDAWVWKWLHEHGCADDGIDSESVVEMARSFSAFLERMADDWEAFVRDDRAWRFMSG